jgi:2,5-diketo-D-gluconate reductase B
MDRITSHGMNMPRLGLGTWPMKGADCTRAVESALGMGYRHIDTAQMYGNEAEVGAALGGSGIARGDIHVTTKVWWDQLAPDAMRRAMESSLQKLGTDYVDLYLIHWPAADMDLPAAIATLVRLREEGLARAIGVSNFPVALMRRAVEELGAPIAANQVEYHAMLDQTPVLDYARRHDVALIAYAPTARGTVADEPALRSVAERHNASPVQIALAWLLDQPGVVAIPKASTEANQRANLEASRIRLDDTDRAAIARAPKDRRGVNPEFAPAWDKAA